MRYTVVYLPEAEDALADLWLNAPDPRAVSTASNAIDRLLRYRPLDLGEPFGEGYRRLIVEPLAAVDQVFLDDCRVSVVQVELLPP
jgi:hypothetical protein